MALIHAIPTPRLSEDLVLVGECTALQLRLGRCATRAADVEGIAELQAPEDVPWSGYPCAPEQGQSTS